eukprot:Tamp_15968.p1 GENE.Tamp_15968~~Tamp_15968.p1  ORF type:complete len:246 (-),score=43.20 Tamp_15968:763-1476(-)
MPDWREAECLQARLRLLAAAECPAFGPRACPGAVGAHASAADRANLDKLRAVAVLDVAPEFNFAAVFRDALLASGADSSRQAVTQDGCVAATGDTHGGAREQGTAARERLTKKAKNAEAMLQFQQRLRALPLELLHLAVDPQCYAGAGAAAGGEGEVAQRGRAAAPNLKLPKGNISRFLLRRLRPLYSKFICEVVAPDVAAAMAPSPCSSVFFQTSPCLRMAPPSNFRATHPHCDAM